MSFTHRGLPDVESVTGDQATPTPRPSLRGLAGRSSTTATWPFMRRAKNDSGCLLVRETENKVTNSSEEETSRRLGQCTSSMGSFQNGLGTWPCSGSSRDTTLGRRRQPQLQKQQRGKRDINTIGANTDQNNCLGKRGDWRDRGLESMVEKDRGPSVRPFGKCPSSSRDDSASPDRPRKQHDGQQCENHTNPPRRSNKRTACIRNPCKTKTKSTSEPTTNRSKRRLRRQIFSTTPPPATSTLPTQQTSPPPSLLTAVVTGIPDPSLGVIQSDIVVPTATSTQTPDSATISTGIIVTIVLATVAGVVALSLAVLLINIQLRRRKRRRATRRSHSPTGSDKKDHSMNTSTPMLDSTFTSGVPSFTMTPMSSEDGFVGGGETGIGLSKLRPPPRLLERNYHQATRSEGSISVKPSRSQANMHTRWGKPSSLGCIPSVKDLPPVYYANDAQTGNMQRTLPNNHGRTPNYSLFPTTTTATTAATTTAKTHRQAPSTSTTSSTRSNRITPPQTPRETVHPPVNGLTFPGPPQNRVLPSPPIKYWHANPLLSPPRETLTPDIRPEEIGVAIGSPTMEERREKRPRLDESDMERLGGTYSPFKR